MVKIGNRAKRFLDHQAGGVAIEYAVIGVLIAVAIFGAVMALGQNSVVQPYQDISKALEASDA